MVGINTAVTGLVSAIPFAGTLVERIQNMPEIFPPRTKNTFNVVGGMGALIAWAWVQFGYAAPTFIWIPAIVTGTLGLAFFLIFIFFVQVLKRRYKSFPGIGVIISIILYLLSLFLFSYSFNSWERHTEYEVLFGFLGNDIENIDSPEIIIRFNTAPRAKDKKMIARIHFGSWYSVAFRKSLAEHLTGIMVSGVCSDGTNASSHDVILNNVRRKDLELTDAC